MNVLSNCNLRHSVSAGDFSVAKDDDSTAASSVFSSNDSVHEQAQNQPTNVVSDDCPIQQQASVENGAIQTGRWKIKGEEISELPEFYPRLSNPLTFRDSEVSEIGDHLFTFLRTNEVISAYDSSKGRVLCRTQRVGFVVQFWRRNEEIILEVQRRQGCSWSMQKIRRDLKRSMMTGQTHIQRPRRHSSYLPPVKRNIPGVVGLMPYQPLLLPSQMRPVERSPIVPRAGIDCNGWRRLSPLGQFSSI